MKFLIICISLLLINCGTSGGNNSTTTPTPTPSPSPSPTCKSLYSVWDSDTTSAEFNFVGMEGGVTNSNYEFLASDASICGTGNTLSAHFYTPASPFDYVVLMHSTSALAGHCADYPNGGGNNYGIGIDATACNQLTICTTADTNCETFH